MSLSRRGFLKGLAASAAGALLPKIPVPDVEVPTLPEYLSKVTGRDVHVITVTGQSNAVGYWMQGETDFDWKDSNALYDWGIEPDYNLIPNVGQRSGWKGYYPMKPVARGVRVALGLFEEREEYLDARTEVGGNTLPSC